MRTILLLSVLASLAGLTVACGDADTNQLAQAEVAQGEDDSTAQDEDKTEPAKPATKTETPAKTAPATPPKTDAKTCDPNTAATKKDCATCCAQKAPAKVVDSCACGVAGKCTTVCQENVCKGGIPDVKCGLCLIQEGCDFTAELGDIGTEAAECLQQCADKP